MISFFNLFKRLMVLSLVGIPAWAGRDVSFSKTMHFKIVPVGASYVLASSVTVEQDYLTRRATGEHVFHVAEYSHTKVSNLQAECRGKALDSKAFSFFFPHPEDVFVSSAKVHAISFPENLSAGDRITYSYDVQYESIDYFPLIYVPALNAVNRLEIVIDHPDDVSIDFQVFSARQKLVPVLDRENPKTTRFVLRDLPEPGLLPGDPYREIHGAILTRISRKGVPVNPYTPEAFATWYLGLLEPTSVPSEAMRSLLSEELKQAKTPREKVRLLFDYVKSNIRYIADEGSGFAFIPHDCRDVLEKKWGDCKGKARLLSVLGRMHGLPVHMALVSTVPTPEFEEVNIGLFNHMICVFEDGERLVFMDPTAPQSELGEPPGQDRLVKALVLDLRHPRYVVVPDELRQPNMDISIRLDGGEGDHKGKARIRTRQATRGRWLQAHTVLDPREFDRYARNRLESILPKVVFEKVKLVSSDSQEACLEAEVDLGDLFVATEQKTYIASAPFKLVEPKWLDRAKDPHVLDVQGSDWLRMVVEVPAKGYQGGAETRRHFDQGKDLQFTSTVEVSANGAKVTYEARHPYRLVREADRERFMAFCTNYLQLAQKPLVLQKVIP